VELPSCSSSAPSPVPCPEVKQEAKRRKIKLVILPTRQAIQELKDEAAANKDILHVTC
jgi:hypothetical protein